MGRGTAGDLDTSFVYANNAARETACLLVLMKKKAFVRQSALRKILGLRCRQPQLCPA
jgi:hypothetical protein